VDEVVDGVRRVISKWVNTTTPLIEDALVGDNIVKVQASRRFRVNDEVMIRGPLFAETGLRVAECIDKNTIRLSDGIVSQNWLIDENAVLTKTMNDMFVQGVYYGDPEVIPLYPAVTVFGANESSEWLTLDSTKERFDIQINVYVLESTHEDGNRFLHRLTRTIERGLKKNIYPLVGDHEVTSLKADVITGDRFFKVEDSSIFTAGNRMIIEDPNKMQEIFVAEIIDDETILIHQHCMDDYDRDTAVLIAPTRFMFNSWPASIDFGKVHKGDLLQASTINWFAEEEEMQLMRKQDPQLS
jgi:hypothetical protein